MPGELLEAYKRIEQRQYLMAICLTISTLVTLLLIILYSQLVISNSQSSSNFAAQASNYSHLVVSYSYQLVTLKGQLANLSARYNATIYNLTNPYSKALYENYQVNIPASAAIGSTTSTNSSGPIHTFNTTYTTKYYTYNFSFNAPYQGYLVLNATASAANSHTNSSWEFIISNGKALTNSTLDYYEFESGNYHSGVYDPTVTSRGTYGTSINTSEPSTQYAPLASVSASSVRIPVDNGTVHVWIVNFANQSATITFSAKYVGVYSR